MEMEIELDRKIREICGHLEAVASRLAKDAKERDAIRVAALAYVFALTRHRDKFEHYVATLHQPLTQKEQDRLKDLES